MLRHRPHRFLAPDERQPANQLSLHADGYHAGPGSKDYYFDGSIGLYQAANNSSVWIYPTMRRGGRTMYSLDVTNPASPALKWKIGCPYPGQ